ncbi:MAG: response regulator, partial [Pseudomonadales bacterium]|nr:response regulator [Pseudomonadales bacterium]
DIQLSSEQGSGSSFWFTLPVSIKDDYQYLDHEEIYNLITPVDNDVTVPIEYSQSGKLDSEVEMLRTALTPVATTSSNYQPSPFDHQLSIELRILVVEDNDINLKVIRGFLDKLGLDPVTLTNGLEAVEHITGEGNEYDLVLMDCEMPIMDGYSAAQKIHQWQQQQGVERTPIIALSAHATDLHIQKAADSGMAMHISKPLTFDKFVDAIEAVMG